MARENPAPVLDTDDIAEPVVVEERGPDKTTTGSVVGAVGGAAAGAAAGVAGGPVGVILGAAVGTLVGATVGGMAGAAADNTEIPPATSEPMTGNAGYPPDVDAGVTGVAPGSTVETG
jgi:phage tail tape-measure protein